MNEFELIDRFFARPVRTAVLGIGDDCALVAGRDGFELAITTDMMVEGRHFVPGADPVSLGHKLLAVNLSDLAAMGASPRWALLALALPEADAAWLAAFVSGFFSLADAHGVELVGGDTTRGPRNLTVTAIGEAPAGQAIRRSGARAGDWVWVSGRLGEAALAVAYAEGRVALDDSALAACRARLDRPTPRVELGIALRRLATAMIDVSDGLAGDLAHICERSAVGARVDVSRIPRAPAMDRLLRDAHPAALPALLAGGDDYELCFTAPASHASQIEAVARELALDVAAIGEVLPVAAGAAAIEFVDGTGARIAEGFRAYDHFRGGVTMTAESGEVESGEVGQ